MPNFVNPFSGKLPDRKLSEEELIRAIRLDIAAEEEAVHLYKAHADATDNEYAKKVLNKVADEEVVHVGEFQKLLLELTGNNEADLLNKGAEEVDKMKSSKESKMNEFNEKDLDKISQRMFSKNFQELPDYDHQNAVKGELKREMLNKKNKGKTFTKDDIYSESKLGNKKMNINEMKDVNLYKRLINIFGEYANTYPMTSMDSVFDMMIEKGKKVLPSDKRAIAILQYLIDETDAGASVQKIMNTRFSELPPALKPISKDGNKHTVAFWNKQGKIFDLTRDLLNLDGKGSGVWSDAAGKKISLVNKE